MRRVGGEQVLVDGKEREWRWEGARGEEAVYVQYAAEGGAKGEALVQLIFERGVRT